LDQFGRNFCEAVGTSLCPSIYDCDCVSFDPAVPAHVYQKCGGPIALGRFRERPKVATVGSLDRWARAATTSLSAWSSEGFKKAFGPQAAAAALTNLQNADVDRAKAILFHPQSKPIQDVFMIGVNEVVSGAKSEKSAMTAAAEKANAVIRG
jgi:hypothetical protein